MALGLLLYLGGYGLMRRANIALHRVGYVTSSVGQREVTNHRVTVELGPAMLNPPGALLVTIVGALYLPLRWVETGIWYVAEPVGSTFG